MKLDTLNQKENEVITTTQGSEMTVDAEDVQYLFDLLSTNLYSDIYGSIVREYTSNAWDAHVEANVSDPIIVGFETDADLGTYFFVKDYGVGLSEERVDKVFKKWGKSTKRDSNNQIGAFGLGSKSALAYTDSFYIENRYNGKETLYMMSKGESGSVFTEIHSKDTTERNGVTVKIFLKSYYDKREFTNAIEDQLMYFENVYFQDSVSNDYKIYKGNKFHISDYSSGEMRLLLGKVTYPIDFKLLGIERINCPIVVKFEIGELPIVPSRESIKYTPSAKQLILDRIKEVAEEITEKYNSQVKELDDISVYFNNINYSKRYQVSDSYSIPVEWVKKYGLTLNNPIFTPLKEIDISNLDINNLFQRIANVGKIQNNKLIKKHEYSFKSNWKNDKIILRIDTDKINSKTTKYIQSLFPNRIIYLYKIDNKRAYLKPKKGFFNTNYDLIHVLSLKNKPKSQWRETIKKFQDWEDSILNALPAYEDFKPTKEWEDSLKVTKTALTNYHQLRKAEGSILLKYGRISERGSGLVFDNKDSKISELGREKRLCVYGTNQEKDLFEKIYIFNNKNKINLISTTKNNFKYLEILPNYIHINKFMEGKTEIFKRTVTSFMLMDLKIEYKDLFNNTEFLNKLSKSTVELMKDLENYLSLYYPTKSATSYGSFRHTDDFYQSLIEVALANKLVDLEQIAVYNQLKPQLEKFKFIQYLKRDTGYSSKHNIVDECLNFAIDYCKLNKIKLNSNCYISKESFNTIIEWYLTVAEKKEFNNINISDWKLTQENGKYHYEEEIREKVKDYLLTLTNEEILELCTKTSLEMKLKQEKLLLEQETPTLTEPLLVE
jgi:hypothetical protein